jgi:hypothetical protein
MSPRGSTTVTSKPENFISPTRILVKLVTQSADVDCGSAHLGKHTRDEAEVAVVRKQLLGGRKARSEGIGGVAEGLEASNASWSRACSRK